MQRYADLVQGALQTLPEEARPAVTCVSLDVARSARPASSPRLANWRHHAVCALRVRSVVRRTQPDVVHLLDGSHAYLVNLLPRRPPVVVTVHDLIPVLTARGELPGPPPSRLARWLWDQSLAGVRRCSRVLADSATTARDLQRLAAVRADVLAVLHLPISSVPAAASCCVSAAAAGLQDSHGPRSSPFILHLGNNAAYKNREGALRIGALVRQECPIRLVLAGPAPTVALRRLADDLGMAAHVDWRPDVSDAELHVLYRSAGVLLFPSLYEGFGWPPLEAMACGCPVVCSNAASLPEVVGAAALLAAPDDHAGLARHCLEVLSKPELRAELVRHGYVNTQRFTLERFAVGLLDAYRRALATV
jgi:glycosyltransferase involved in cell wall biosynthesis